MKATLKLGTDIKYLSSSITNVFTTYDYYGIFCMQYLEHVDKYYGQCDNEFRKLHDIMKFFFLDKYEYRPYKEPLSDIGDCEVAMKSIIGNRNAYRYIVNLVKEISEDCIDRQVNIMTHNLLNSLVGGTGKFRDHANTFDRHLGNFITTSKLINAVYLYGKLSGLVDYYNLEEGLDEHT